MTPRTPSTEAVCASCGHEAAAHFCAYAYNSDLRETCGCDELAEARAPLDVERLARAVSLVMSDLDWTPAPIGVVQNSYWQDRAEGIAREYAALEEPTP